MMKIRLAQGIFRPDVKPLYRVTSQNKGSFCLLFHDQSERSPDCGLDADELTNNCIRRIFLSPTKKKKNRLIAGYIKLGIHVFFYKCFKAYFMFYSLHVGSYSHCLCLNVD